MSSFIVAAGDRRRSLGVGFENMRRLGSSNEEPSRNWAWWRLDGWWAAKAKAQGRGMG